MTHMTGGLSVGAMGRVAEAPRPPVQPPLGPGEPMYLEPFHYSLPVEAARNMLERPLDSPHLPGLVGAVASHDTVVPFPMYHGQPSGTLRGIVVAPNADRRVQFALGVQFPGRVAQLLDMVRKNKAAAKIVVDFNYFD